MDSEVYGWGFGGFGGLATGKVTNQPVPIQIEQLSEYDIEKISIGVWHTAFITTTGQLYVVGRGRYGTLGTGDETDILLQPHRVKAFEGKRVIDVACGTYHTICATDDGTAWSFGFGLGCGHGTAELNGHPREIKALRGRTIVQVSAGVHLSACVDKSGATYMWGQNQGAHPVPVSSLQGVVIRKLVCGARHVLALSDTGLLYGCGSNDEWQLGPARWDEPIIAVPNRNDGNNCNKINNNGAAEKWVDISAGYSHSIGLTNFGNVYIWGSFAEDDSSRSRKTVISSPKLVTGLEGLDIKSIGSGSSFFAILTRDGRVYTFGFNGLFQCGLGHNKYVAEPTLVEGLGSRYIHAMFVGGHNCICIAGSPMTTEFRKLMNKERAFADVTLSVGPDKSTQVTAHRFVLAARSPVLKKLLAKQASQTGNNDNDRDRAVPRAAAVVRLDDLIQPPELLPHVVEFLYTNSTKLPAASLADAFAVCASKLQINAKVDRFNNTVAASLQGYEQDILSIIDKEDSFPDVKFILDDGSSLWAHKAVLIKAPYFKAMLAMGMIESKQSHIEFHNASKAAFESLFRYIYCGQVKIEPEISVEMLELSCRMNWPRLKFHAESIILSNLDASNALPMIKVGQYCEAPSIISVCTNIVAMNYDELSQSEEFAELDEEVRAQIQKAHDTIIASRDKFSKWTKKAEEEKEEEEERQRQRQMLAAPQDQDSSILRRILGGSSSSRNNDNNGNRSSRSTQQRENPCSMM